MAANIKVNRLRLIEALEKSAAVEQAVKDKYEKDLKLAEQEEKKNLQKISAALKAGKGVIDSTYVFTDWHDKNSSKTRITIVLNEVFCVERPDRDWASERRLERITELLKILALSDDDFVPQSIVKSVGDLI